MIHIIRTYDIDEGEASTIEYLIFDGPNFDPIALMEALRDRDIGFEVLNDVLVFDTMNALMTQVSPGHLQRKDPADAGCQVCGDPIYEIQPERARAAKRVYFDVAGMMGFRNYDLCWSCWDGIVDQFLADEDPKDE